MMIYEYLRDSIQNPFELSRSAQYGSLTNRNWDEGNCQLSIVSTDLSNPKKNIEEHRRFLMSTESTVDDFWINCCSLCRVPPPSLHCEFIAPLFYRRATACRRGSNLSCLKVVIPTLDGSKWFKPNPAVPSSGSKERNYHLVMTHNCSSPWTITIL